VLRRIFGPKMYKVTGEWRRLHNEELNNLYFSPNIIQMIKLKRVRSARHVAHSGERRGVYRVFVEDPGIDGRIVIIIWIFRKWYGEYGMDSSVSGYGQVVGSCKRGHVLLGSIKYGEFLD